MSTYILLPIITIFISEFFKDIGWEILLVRAVILLTISTGIVLITLAFASTFNDILNPDVKELNCFIKDIEDIKLFKSKAEVFKNKDIDTIEV